MIIIFVIVFLLLVSFAYAGLRGAPWVPTKSDDVERFLKLADIKAGAKVYDLGCGDGRLLCAAARAGAEATGWELSLLPYALANVRRLFQEERKHIKIIYGDFWRTDLSEADVIYFFLMPKVYPKIKAKFEKELKKGAKVISYVWPIEGWQSEIIDCLEGQASLYLYMIK